MKEVKVLGQIISVALAQPRPLYLNTGFSTEIGDLAQTSTVNSTFIRGLAGSGKEEGDEKARRMLVGRWEAGSG